LNDEFIIINFEKFNYLNNKKFCLNMLILNDELWQKDSIIKIWCSNTWDGTDDFIMNECVLNRLKELLIDAHETDREGILVCDCNKGTFPPLTQALQIVAYMVSMKQQIENGLSYTIIYAKSKEHRSWIDNILTIYKPARPVRIVSSKEDVKNYILNGSN